MHVAMDMVVVIEDMSKEGVEGGVRTVRAEYKIHVVLKRVEINVTTLGLQEKYNFKVTFQ